MEHTDVFVVNSSIVRQDLYAVDTGLPVIHVMTTLPPSRRSALKLPRLYLFVLNGLGGTNAYQQCLAFFTRAPTVYHDKHLSCKSGQMTPYLHEARVSFFGCSGPSMLSDAIWVCTEGGPTRLSLSPSHECEKKKIRNGGFGTFLRAFYAALERRRSVSPAISAVAFGGSDDEWASLQVLTCKRWHEGVTLPPSHLV